MTALWTVAAVLLYLPGCSHAQIYELPLCDVSAPYASLVQTASNANVTTSSTAVFSTTVHFSLVQKFNYSETVGPHSSLWWRSNDIIGAASRARAFPAGASWTGISTDVQPFADENITVVREGEVANVSLASFPYSTAEALVWTPNGAQDLYAPVPLLAAVHPANLTGWVGGPASSPMMSVWAAIRGNRTDWPQGPLYAGLDLSPSRRPGTGRAQLDSLCTAAQAGTAMGSLVLGGLHEGYNVSSLQWSEGAAPWPSDSPLLPYTGWGSLFPLYRPQLCGVDMTDGLKGSGHWLAEVDTGSACTVLPAPLFDIVTRWAPLVNCPPPGRYSEGGDWIESTAFPYWQRKECEAGEGAAGCGYSILDSRICDLDPDASAAVLAGTAGLPVLTAWLSSPQPQASGQGQGQGGAMESQRMIQLPLADLMVPREMLRGPKGLSDPIRELPPTARPTHALCLVRGSMGDTAVEGPGVGTASQAQRALFAAGTQRIRIGTLALKSLYVAWELRSGFSSSRNSSTPIPWEEWMTTPMRPVRVGLAHRGLGNGTAAQGYGPYAQCVQPVASTCKGAQVYSTVLNACLDPACGRYSLQAVDPGTGLCVMHPFTAFLAILAITASGGITVYMYVARWLAAAAAVRHMSARERGPASAGPAWVAGGRHGAGGGAYDDLTGSGGSRSPTRRAQVLRASQSSDASSGEAAFALLRQRQVEEVEAQGSVRQRRGAGGRRGSTEDSMPPGLPRTWGSPFARQEEEEAQAQAQTSFREWLASFYPTLSMVGRYASVYGRAEGEGEGAARGRAEGEEEGEEDE